mmetsp:Transcript_31417/g.75973  ORF Transcript_31417/g.75973 Transcript_31417/m.75973 type:complete len:169 (-) Transcript_31417:13-519(-)
MQGGLKGTPWGAEGRHVPFSCGAECSALEYVDTVCNHDAKTKRNCSECTVCPEEQFATVPCNGTDDTVCAECSPRVDCGAEEFSKNCSAIENGRCEACMAAFCAPWEWSAGCDNNGTVDYYCVNCTYPTWGGAVPDQVRWKGGLEVRGMLPAMQRGRVGGGAVHGHDK